MVHRHLTHRGYNVELMKYRIGHGYDLHRLKSGSGLVLGGIHIPCDVSTIAHSDGDVIMHAIADSLYSAIGDGDIGMHFPNSDEINRNQDSSVFLLDALNRCHKAGWNVGNISVTVDSEKPNINANRDSISKHLSHMVNGTVHVKGKTTEQVKDANAIEVHAVTLLHLRDSI